MTDSRQQSYPEMGQNPSMYHPNGLTPEEADLLKQLRFESSVRAGYPMALIAGGAVAMLTKNKTRAVRIGLTITGIIGGNIVGKLSYLPTIRQRIIDELPESSLLRQQAMKMTRGRDMSSSNDFQTINPQDSAVEFATKSEYDMKNMDVETEDVPKSNKYMTHDELRRRHREKQQGSDFTV